MNKVCLLVLLIGVGTFICFPGFAQNNQDTTERITHIKQILAKDELSARNWYYNWMIGYSTVTVLQIAGSCLFHSVGTKQDMALGAISSGLGIAGTALSAFKPGFGKFNRLPCPFDKKDSLQYAEDLLKQAALTEKEARSWKVHVICGAINAGSGLITWICFKRSVWDGLEIFLINTAVTEFQIWSSPYRAYKDYNEYYRHKQVQTLHSYTCRLKCTAGITPGSVLLRLSF
jgi:hypothetical protein